MNQKVAKVAINRQIVDKNISGNAYYMANEWENVDLTIEELARTVAKSGYAFCAQLNGTRSSTNYKLTNLVSLDVDAGITLKEALEDEFSKKYLSFYYTTTNHTVEENRFRLCFLLEKDLDDGKDYTAIKRALGLKYCGDPSTYDPSRISYGNQNAAFEFYDSTVPEEIIKELIELGKSPVSLSKTDSSTGEFNNSFRRSSIKISLTTEVRIKNGLLTRLGEISEQTQIHCPFHRDNNASAFANKNSRASTYLFCIVCQTTWWVQSEKELARLNRLENEFTTVIKNLKLETKKRAAERIIPADLNLRKFPLTGIGSIEIINQKFLERSSLQSGLTLIRSPKGSGKTESLTEIVRNLVASKHFRTLEDIENTDFDEAPRSFRSDYKVLLIGHRQALIRQLCERLDLNCYLDDKDHNYQEIKLRKNRYGVCLDSLWKVIDIKYDLVVIDESEQVLAHMLSDTMKNRETIFKGLNHVIISAKNVVALDADLGWTTYLTLTEMRGVTTPLEGKNRVWIVINEYVADGSPIDIYSSKEELIGQMMLDIADDKKVFVASNSKRLIEKLSAAIDATFGKGKSFAVTSSNSRTDEVQFEIMNFKNTFEKYNVLLCSPSLGTGVDITFEDNEQVVDCCYGFFESLINTHLDIDQQIRRVRHPKQVRVWISSRTFNFETEFGVIKHQLLLDKVIANTFIGFHLVSREEVYNETDPFLTMASHIVSDQRESQNNLKQNFIEYKTKTGWLPQIIEKNDGLTDQGRVFLVLGKKLDDEAYIQKLFNARPINRLEFEIIQESLDNDTQLPESDYWSFRRISLELFYQKQLTEEVIRNDNRGELRKQYKLFSMITDLTNIKFINKNFSLKYDPKTKTIPFDRLKERDAKTALLHTLLSSSPVFKDCQFDLSCVYTMSDLSAFSTACLKLSGYVEAQFNNPIRLDVEKKPTTQFHWFLKMVGINTISKSKKVNGSKTYQYKIDPKSLNTMLDLVELHNSLKSEWDLVNKLHGF